MTLLLNLVWYALALLAVASALVTVLARNPLRGACALLLHIATLSVFYLMLSAEFLAVLQLLVYGGATVVLFIFVVMLLGSAGEAEVAPERRAASRLIYVVGALGGLLTLVAAVGISHSPAAPALERVPLGSVSDVGRLLFTEYWLVFEALGMLLTVAMVTALAVTRTTGWHTRKAPAPASSELAHAA